MDISDPFGPSSTLSDQFGPVLTHARFVYFFSGCPTAVVDGKTVCIGTAENYTFKCSYSLADQTVTDNFDVSGQDTQTDAENTGTLGYTLEVRSGFPRQIITYKCKICQRFQSLQSHIQTSKKQF